MTMTESHPRASAMPARSHGPIGMSPPPPRWARRAAALAVLTTLPSGLWRVVMALGVPLGVSDEVRRSEYGHPGWGTAYVFGLTILLVGLSLLTLGLVQRWGEVVPRWIPFIGGKDVPRLAAVIPAGAGAVALTLLWLGTFASLGQIVDYYGLKGAALGFMLVCYSPILLWGPLLGAVTISYARRRAGAPRPDRVGRPTASAE